MPPIDISGIWADEITGGLIRIERNTGSASSVIAHEYPHMRTWGTLLGVMVGNTIRGVNFRQVQIYIYIYEGS